MYSWIYIHKYIHELLLVSVSMWKVRFSSTDDKVIVLTTFMNLIADLKKCYRWCSVIVFQQFPTIYCKKVWHIKKKSLFCQICQIQSRRILEIFPKFASILASKRMNVAVILQNFTVYSASFKFLDLWKSMPFRTVLRTSGEPRGTVLKLSYPTAACGGP